MRKSNYTEEQIAFALKQAELGTPVEEERLREECLNAHWFLSLDDARRKIRSVAGVL